MLHKIILGIFMTTAYVLGVTTGMLMEKDQHEVKQVLIKYEMFKGMR